VKNVFTDAITTIVTNRNFQVDLTSRNGILADRYSMMDAINGTARILMSRNATSMKMKKMRRRNFVRGSSL
jgi:hypothetical protein